MTKQEDRNVFSTLLTVGSALTAFFIFSMVSANAAVDSMVESATIDRIKPFGEVNIGSAQLHLLVLLMEKVLTVHLVLHVMPLVQRIHLSLVIKVRGKHVLHKETVLCLIMRLTVLKVCQLKAVMLA